jgi:hypothetical protein
MRSLLAALPVVMVGLLIGLIGALDAGNPNWQRALFGFGLALMVLGSLFAIVRRSRVSTAPLSRPDDPS